MRNKFYQIVFVCLIVLITFSSDSGGGLLNQKISNGVASWFLAGIVSFGSIKCGTNGVPGVYTKVDHYYSWILNKIKP